MTVDDLRADVLTAQQVAEILTISPDTVYRQARKGKIPCRRIGKRFIFSKTALALWLTQQVAVMGTGNLNVGK